MTNPISLPLLETVTHSFMFVIKNIKAIAKICSVFVVLWLAEIGANFPALCVVEKAHCVQSGISVTLTVLLFLASMIIGVETIRHLILKQEYNWFHFSFGKATLKYIAYNLLISLFVIIPFSLILTLQNYALAHNASLDVFNTLKSLALATFALFSILCFRFYLVFGAAAVENKKINLKRSYVLTAGNTLKLCAGQILLWFPVAFVLYLIFSIYMLGNWGYFAKSIFVLLGMCVSFFGSALKASYYAHIYQFFSYSEKRRNSN